jgi:trimeric autotransporter adhesin
MTLLPPASLRPSLGATLACLTATTALLLSACGGGGGGIDAAPGAPSTTAAAPAPDAAPATTPGTPDPAPGAVSPAAPLPPAPAALTLSAAPKQLSLTWTAAPEATGYLLQRKLGSGAWTDVGSLLGASTLGTTVDLAPHLFDWASTRYRVLACGAVGCGASPEVAVIDRMLETIAALDAPVPGDTDKFGLAVALSADGSTLAVGAPDEDSNAVGIGGDEANDDATDAGAVHVFVRSGTGWVRQAYVKASNTAAGDAFGRALALSTDGSTLAVGAPGEDGTATDSGAVYVFTRSGTTWTQQQRLKAAQSDASDAFGTAVSLAGDGGTLAASAPGEDGAPLAGEADNSLANSGAVYVFERAGATWSQQAWVKASNARSGDTFGGPLPSGGVNTAGGRSVALSADGQTLAVGANLEDGDDGGVQGTGGITQSGYASGNSGAVYVFARSGSVWTPQAYVKPATVGPGDQFGIAVALSADGGTLAVGATNEDGASRGIGGDETSGSASNSGAAYVFTRSGTVWSQQAYVKASNTATGDQFGQHVALSADGTLLAVGARAESGRTAGVGGDQTNPDPGATTNASGAVYLFGFASGAWSQRSYVKGRSVAAEDAFGTSVALSADGTALAVGAPLPIQASTPGVSGSVFVY